METENFPKHIAIIMDGNRRWAKEKKLPVKLGHKAGADNLKKITRYVNGIGVQYLTVYAFSTENWKRSEDEVNGLMFLLKTYGDDFIKEANNQNVKINIIGEMDGLSEGVKNMLKKSMDVTNNNTGLVLNIAFNYGGRAELVKASKEIALDVKNGKISEDDINEELISKHLYTANMPDPDLLIRTSGEMRISGFLIWQISYTEFVFVNKYWPDFSEKDVDLAIEEYQKRNRKYGGQ